MDPPAELAPKPSRAARMNATILKRMQDALAADPEIDLTTRLPTDYSTRLEKMRTTTETKVRPVRPHEEDRMYPGFWTAPDSLSLSERLIALFKASPVLWKGASPGRKMVFRCNASTVAKAVRNMTDFTGYTTLLYLRQHRPGNDIPIPEPLGMLRLNSVVLIFMTYQPGEALTKVWPILDKAQKRSVQEQLNATLTTLRSLPFTPGTPFGGTAGEGCKDVRRHVRRGDRPITAIDEFEQFLCTGHWPGGHVFVELLRELSPPASACTIVFTHGDLRPDNITVQPT
ncbi:hypothetical protein BDW74DRAFT_180857 [Aspergillus multicolor]|uniref:phosphotransferase family protein n=1 Tax=Aspergillus multicolor TaxID=41759 RepID=UPI003CCDBD0D